MPPVAEHHVADHQQAPFVADHFESEIDRAARASAHFVLRSPDAMQHVSAASLVRGPVSWAINPGSADASSRWLAALRPGRGAQKPLAISHQLSQTTTSCKM